MWKEINQNLGNYYNKYIQGMLDTEEEKPGAMKKLYHFVKYRGQDSFGVSTPQYVLETNSLICQEES